MTNTLDNQPMLVMCKICNYLDRDIDYINLTMCCKKFYTKSDKYRSLRKSYKSSVIAKSIYRYDFRDIIYDYPIFSIDLVPVTIEKITFLDNFNDDISELFNLSNLNFVLVGPSFTNFDSIVDISYRITNRRKILLQIIANCYATKYYHQDISNIAQVSYTKKLYFPGYFNKIAICKIQKRKLLKILNDITQEINETIFVSILKILDGYTSEMENFGLYMSYINSAYAKFFYNINSITWQHNKHFFNDKLSLLSELINDLLCMLGTQQIFLAHIYTKLALNFNCSDIVQYTNSFFPH